MAQAKMKQTDGEGLEPVKIDVEGPEVYVPEPPTPEQEKAAKEVLHALKKGVDGFGAERTVEALLQIVDRITPFTTPESWPAGEEVEYAEAKVVENIATFLARGCPRLTIDPAHVVYLFRNKDKWMEGERPKRGATARFNTRVRSLLKGQRAALEINYHHWLVMNPLQKVQEVYHQLRSLNEDGGRNPVEFSGYLDELEIFGFQSFHEHVRLGVAMQRAMEVEHEHQLPLFPPQDG